MNRLKIKLQNICYLCCHVFYFAFCFLVLTYAKVYAEDQTSGSTKVEVSNNQNNQNNQISEAERTRINTAYIDAKKKLEECLAKNDIVKNICKSEKETFRDAEREKKSILPTSPDWYLSLVSDTQDELEEKFTLKAAKCSNSKDQKKNAKDCQFIESEIARLTRLITVYSQRAGVETPAEYLKSQCQDKEEEYKEKLKDCGVDCIKQMNYCIGSEDDLLSRDSRQLLQSVGGLNPLAGIATAALDQPECRLSKEDFKDEKANVKDDLKTAQDELKQLKTDALDAQKNYSDKIKDLVEKEGEIRDKVADLPNELRKNKKELLRNKDNEITTLESQITTLDTNIRQERRSYNALVAARSNLLRRYSNFKIQEDCLQLVDPSRFQGGASGNNAGGNNGNAAGGNEGRSGGNAARNQAIINQVNSSLSNAFYTGKTIKTRNDNLYNECVSDKRAEAAEAARQAVDALREQDSKIKDLEKQYGVIDQRVTKLNQQYAEDLQELDIANETETAKLRASYLDIQNQKADAKTLLDQELAENQTQQKSLSQKIAALNIKQNLFTTRKPPQTSEKNFYQTKQDFDSLVLLTESSRLICCSKQQKSNFCNALEFNDKLVAAKEKKEARKAERDAKKAGKADK